MAAINTLGLEQNKSWVRGAVVLWCAAVMAVLSGCKDATGQTPGQAPPPPEVGVITVQPGTVDLQTELPGRVEALRTAEIRAQATGIVQQRLFREGSDVKAGQVLFQIDPAPYEAAYESAQAAIAKAQANVEQTTALAQRYEPLVKAKAISQQEYVNAVAAQQQAQADVGVARAAAKTAKINLDYTSVRAPIAGRIGQALVTEGALVSQSSATQLALVQQIDKVYVNFTQPATEVFKLRRAVESGQLKQMKNSDAVSVRVVLEDGSEYEHAGKLLFSNIAVDATSGQITLRAEVPNPERQLLPGLYVRVRLEQAQAAGAILLPQQAVTRNSQGNTVMVVDGEGKVSPRAVQISAGKNGQWVVLDGLKEGEQVVVEGLQKLRNVPKVKPVPWKTQTPQPAATPAVASEQKKS